MLHVGRFGLTWCIRQSARLRPTIGGIVIIVVIIVIGEAIALFHDGGIIAQSFPYSVGRASVQLAAQHQRVLFILLFVNIIYLVNFVQPLLKGAPT